MADRLTEAWDFLGVLGALITSMSYLALQKVCASVELDSARAKMNALKLHIVPLLELVGLGQAGQW